MNAFVSPKEFQTGEQLIFTKKICSANALNQCEALLFLAHRAAFLYTLSGLWGRDWKGKLCCPFLGCGGLEPIAKRVPSFCYFLA